MSRTAYQAGAISCRCIGMTKTAHTMNRSNVNAARRAWLTAPTPANRVAYVAALHAAKADRAAYLAALRVGR